MPVVLPADVANLHDAIKAELDGLDAAVAQAVSDGKIVTDSVDYKAWQAMKVRAAGYLSQGTSSLNPGNYIDTGAQMDAGQALQRDLAPWNERILSWGAKAPPATAAPPAEASLQSTLASIAEPLKWLVLGYLAMQFFAARRATRGRR